MGLFYDEGENFFDHNESVKENPIIEAFYISEQPSDGKTILFCPQCEINFFAGLVKTTLDLIAVRAAEQIALQHAELLEHQVCKASPERLL